MSFLKLGIIGRPLNHSLSPMIHRQIGHALGLELEYKKYPTSASELTARLDQLAQEGVVGVNVTAPLKLAISPIVNTSDFSEGATGINSIRFKEGRIQGVTNTDTYGFQAQLNSHVPTAVLVIGAGGVLGSVLKVLSDLDVSPVTITNRTPPRDSYSRAMIQGSDGWSFIGGEPVDLRLEATPCVVHGLPRHALESSLMYIERCVGPGTRFFDLNYGEGTRAVEDAVREAGGFYVTGMDMLLHQALKSFEFFTGCSTSAVDFEVLKKKINTSMLA